MTTRVRSGRRQRIAHDTTPITSTAPDLDARIGWLLAMSRLHHPDPTFADGAAFTAALADTGAAPSRSLVSRWESGGLAVSYEGMSGYETTLGLEPGQLTSLSGYIRASLPGVPARVVRPRLDPATTEFADRLDLLLDMVVAQRARARDWQELGWHLAATPAIYLPSGIWESLAHQIVNLLPRGVKVAYRQLSTAAMNIATLPRARDHVVATIDRYRTDPDAQVLTNPLGILDQLPTRGAARIVLDLVEDPPTDAVYRLAVWLATQKVARDDFDAEERARLDMLVLARWRSDADRAAGELAELIAELPEGLRSTLTEAAARSGRRRLGYVVEHGEEIPTPRAAALSHDLAETARAQVPQQAAYAEDRMLVRLVREGLFHRTSERRHLASLILSASPFRAAVADQALTLAAASEVCDAVRARAATLVRYLGDETHRLRMQRLLDDPCDAVAIPITQGFGHLPMSKTSDLELRRSLGREQGPREQARMYALGMSGSPVLETLATSEDAPVWQRRAARWWLALGPAIRC